MAELSFMFRLCIVIICLFSGLSSLLCAVALSTIGLKLPIIYPGT
jgi:hypothetical protein